MRLRDSNLDFGSSHAVASGHQNEPLLPALMIAWAPSEPERLGEVALIEPEGGARILGRGAAPEGSGCERLVFSRQRPGSLEPSEPLQSQGLSREQLRIRVERGRLKVERIGRCPMEVSGQRVDRCVLEPGDSLLLKGQMLLFFTRRPRKLPALRSASLHVAPGFGMPDAYGFVGESPVAWRLRDQLAWIAGADEHTLLLGESGSGKELCARAVHALSARANGAFVVQNEATIPPGLVDAKGGTIFLDEMEDLPQSSQADLLRALDEGGESPPFGGSAAKRPSFRVLGATNREPEALKHELAARLVLRLHVPGLDERRDDIPLLVRHLLRRALEKSPDALRRFCSSEGGGEPLVRASVIEALMKHHYTSNIRELDGLLWRAISASAGDVIAWPDEPPPKGPPASPFRKDESSPGVSRPSDTPDPTETEVRAALAEHKGNIVRTSHALGLSSRYVLYRLMRRYGIEGVREEQ